MIFVNIIAVVSLKLSFHGCISVKAIVIGIGPKHSFDHGDIIEKPPEIVKSQAVTMTDFYQFSRTDGRPTLTALWAISVT